MIDVMDAARLARLAWLASACRAASCRRVPRAEISSSSPRISIVSEVRRLGLQPTLFGIEYSYDWLDSVPEIRQSIQFFNNLTLQFPE